MGKYAAPEAGEEMIEPNTQPMLAIHRRGHNGEPYLAISTHQRARGPEFSRPGCQYAIGGIAVQEWRNAHQQHLFVSFDKDTERAVVTSRLYFPHPKPTAIHVGPLDSSPAYPRWLPWEVDLLDYDYRVPDSDLLKHHKEHLSATHSGQCIHPTDDRLAEFYNCLLDAAIAASQ